jgi:Dihydrodipicolinate synthase/N-acetylneuraminate lyase
MNEATGLRGVFPVVPVPFGDDGEVDTHGFESVITHTITAGVAGLMFPGFASEYHKLSEIERRMLRDVLLQHTAPIRGLRSIVSITDHATHLAVENARAAADAGADVLNLLPPHFLAPSRAAVRKHLHTVIAACAPIPVIVQYAPELTGHTIDIAVLAELARTHANFRMVKVESTPPGSMITALQKQRPPLAALVGYAGLQIPDAFARGADGVQPGCASVEVYQAIWTLYDSGEVEEAVRLHRRLLPYLAYWMQNVELIIAAEKQICFRRGLIESPHCRAPAWTLDALELAMIDEFLDEFADFFTPRTEPGSS